MLGKPRGRPRIKTQVKCFCQNWESSEHLLQVSDICRALTATSLCRGKIKGYWCCGPRSISDMHRHVPSTKPALLLFVNSLCRRRMGVEQVFPYFHSLHIPPGERRASAFRRTWLVILLVCVDRISMTVCGPEWWPHIKARWIPVSLRIQLDLFWKAFKVSYMRGKLKSNTNIEKQTRFHLTYLSQTHVSWIKFLKAAKNIWWLKKEFGYTCVNM